MTTITLQLDPSRLENPDLDIRYILPDLLVEKSNGILSDDSYDYVGDSNRLLLFLRAKDPVKGLACVLNVIENERVLGNDLRKVTIVTIDRGGVQEIVFPRS
jgi:hypothetical protein